MGRIVLGAVVGLVAMFACVILATWGAMWATGLSMESPPTLPYLLLNLTGSVLAAVLGGYLAVRIARGRVVAGWIVAGALLLIALPGLFSGSGGAPGQPTWYPATVAVLGVAGVVAGSALAARRAGGSIRGSDPV
jgi:hypothetical protein